MNQSLASPVLVLSKLQSSWLQPGLLSQSHPRLSYKQTISLGRSHPQFPNRNLSTVILVPAWLSLTKIGLDHESPAILN